LYKTDKSGVAIVFLCYINAYTFGLHLEEWYISAFAIRTD